MSDLGEVSLHRSECPFDKAAQRAAAGGASSREVATAMNCALLSNCTARCGCLEKVFLLLDRVRRQTFLSAAE